jgi:peroxiredoxin
MHQRSSIHRRLQLATVARWVRTVVLGASGMLMTAHAHAAPPVGAAAPDFALRSLNGENFRLSEYAGDVVLLNFWTSWSGSSRQQIPALDNLYAKYQRAGFVLFGVNLDDDAERASEMAKTLAVSYPVLFDTKKEVARSFQVNAMPLTVLIDRSGVVRFVAESYKPGDEERYAAELRKLLNE